MIRKTISITIFISFLLLVLSSVILYIVPEGRVAYWSDWKILGLSKVEWGHLHITGGLTFLIVSIWHIILNWNPIVNYIRKSTPKNIKSPVPILLAIVINAFIFVGTLSEFQPMKKIIAWNGDIKEHQAKVNGNPPYGHAELSSLESFCGFLGLDVNIVINALSEKKLQGEITRQATILDIAKQNNKTPQQIYDIIRSSISGDPFQLLPPEAPEGTGKMTLEQLCTAYSLPLEDAIQKLSSKGVDATAELSIKEIAQAHKLSPIDVYNILRSEKTVD